MNALPQTIVVPVNMGVASNYDSELFSISSYRNRDSLGRGQLYLDATLDEMLKMNNIGSDPGHWAELIQTTKARYDQLKLQKEDLVHRPKSKLPWKFISNLRADLLFLAASKSLYSATRSRSEEIMRSIGRSLLSLPGDDFQLESGDVPPDTPIAGIAVKLERPLDEAAAQQILDAANTIASFSTSMLQDPFADPTTSATSTVFDSPEGLPASESTASLLGHTSKSSPSPLSSAGTSPTIVNNFYNSFLANGSVVSGATLNNGGIRNRGSSISSSLPP